MLTKLSAERLRGTAIGASRQSAGVRLDRPAAGIGLMLIAVLSLTILDALAKVLVRTCPVPMVVWTATPSVSV